MAQTITHALPHRPSWTDQAIAIAGLRPGAPQTESARRMAWDILRAEKAANRAITDAADAAPQARA